MTPTLDTTKRAILALTPEHRRSLADWLARLTSERKRTDLLALAQDVKERGVDAVAADHQVQPMAIYRRLSRGGVALPRPPIDRRPLRSARSAPIDLAAAHRLARELGLRSAALRLGIAQETLQRRLWTAGYRLRLTQEECRARAVELADRCQQDGPMVVAAQEGISIEGLRCRFRRAGMKMPWKGRGAA